MASPVLDRRDGLDILVLLRPFPEIVYGERVSDLLPPDVGVHIVAAEADTSSVTVFVAPLTRLTSNDERHDADDDAEHRERGAHLI